jgi:hypothetical protein
MRRSKLFLAVVAAMLVAAGVFAQTTGTIEGTISDEKGQSLPGVTAEANSVNLQGTKVAVSDTGGHFRLVFLPPGTYNLRFTLQGFATQEQSAVSVGLGRTVTLQVSMRSAFKEEVVVSGMSPTIDVRSTEIGTNVDSKVFMNLPVQRNFASVLLVTPGTNQDAVGVTVYGSSGAENGYFIDGVNTTGVERGTQGKVLNFEFIQEAQVKTGGYQAEYGRSTGGLINVITKSGGNEFHGDVFGYYEGSSIQDNLSTGTIKDASKGGVDSLQSNHKRADYGVDVGGYLVKDKLWFFGAYNYVKTDEDNKVFRDFTAYGGPNYGFPTPGSIYVGTTKRNLWAGKLTYRVNQNHSFILSAFGDPSTFIGPAPGITMAAQPSVFLRTIDSGATDGTLKYEGVLGTNWVVNAQAAQHKDTNIAGGPGLNEIRFYDRTHPLYLDAGIAPSAGGYGNAQRSKFGRDVYRGDLSYFLSNFGGDHELKIGAEYEHITIDNATYNSGGQRIYMFAGTSPVDHQRYVYYRHRFYVANPDVNPNTVTQADVTNPLTVNTKDNNTAAYIQDTWRVSPSFTLNLGFRWESQKGYDYQRKVKLDITDNYAPRVGFIWDPKGNGKSKIYGSWGYFYETIPVDMMIRSFGNENLIFSYNLNGALNDPNRANVTCEPSFIALRIRSRCTLTIGGGPVDPNLKGQYIQEYILGGEVEVSRDFVVGVKYINRNLGRVIEDFLGQGQVYEIGNPGEGLGKVSYDSDSSTWAFVVPKPKREFQGVELSVKKRFTNNWSLMASYLWSTLKGNYDGTFQASTGQLDPNLNSAFDYGDFQINNTGYLTNDRRHQFKVDASYMFPFGLTVGGTAYWRTGVPITAYGYSFAYENWEFYLSERGAFGRTNDEYEADLHLGYPWKVGGMEVNLLMDVFNVLNRQGETNRNMRYDNIDDYYPMNYSTGAILPPIKPGDTTRPPTNPAFNHANAWQAPRTVRLGVRLTF